MASNFSSGDWVSTAEGWKWQRGPDRVWIGPLAIVIATTLKLSLTHYLNACAKDDLSGWLTKSLLAGETGATKAAGPSKAGAVETAALNARKIVWEWKTKDELKSHDICEELASLRRQLEEAGVNGQEVRWARGSNLWRINQESTISITEYWNLFYCSSTIYCNIFSKLVGKHVYVCYVHLTNIPSCWLKWTSSASLGLVWEGRKRYAKS